VFNAESHNGKWNIQLNILFEAIIQPSSWALMESEYESSLVHRNVRTHLQDDNTVPQPERDFRKNLWKNNPKVTWLSYFFTYLNIFFPSAFESVIRKVPHSIDTEHLQLCLKQFWHHMF
jgi:hypothetical protein